MDINTDQCIYPIPVIALNYFKTMILDQFQDKIEQIVLAGIKTYRKNLILKTQNLKNLIELIWCCGLGELARIKASSNSGIFFYQQERINFISKIKSLHHVEQFFNQRILNKILEETQNYYADQYEIKIRNLSSTLQFKTINSILLTEFEFSNQFFLVKNQKKLYMTKIYDKLTVNLLERLKTPGSFKSLLETYQNNSNEKYKDIQLYFQVIKASNNISNKKFKNCLKLIQIILTEVILEQGKQINQKISKRREHIVEMLTLKKSIQKILDQMGNKLVILFSAKDTAFKKILDSIEVSRNLADFVDFTIKQCIKLKLDEERSLEKFNDIFILLSCVLSTDSFLLYHQQLMAKRIIQSLHQPKLEVQLLMLKKLSERMGVMSVSSHMSMIKDMQVSQQLTEKYNNLLPFSPFKMSLKIFNPSFWPLNTNKQKISIQIPNYLLYQAKAIQQLYHSQNQYRYLNWKLDKGISLFDGKFASKRVRFQSQNSYLMILLLISQQPQNKIIFGNLKKFVKTQKNSQTIVKHDHFSMLLYVLIENKLITRINVTDKYAPFSQSQELQINKNYVIPNNIPKGQQVIVIKPSQQMAKNLQQSSIEKNKIIKDREKLIEALLVKVLKHSHATSGNSISFAQLFQAVKNHHILGGFNFSQTVVKQRLQQLIARQYCIRDEDDRRIYHYIA